MNWVVARAYSNISNRRRKMTKPLMKCGHIANAKDGNGNYGCAICGCHEIADLTPSLAGRKAKCTDCGRIVKSNENLPFFKYQPDEEFDTYYCGCWGWD